MRLTTNQNKETMKTQNKAQKRILGYNDVTELQLDIFYVTIIVVIVGGMIWRVLTR